MKVIKKIRSIIKNQSDPLNILLGIILILIIGILYQYNCYFKGGVMTENMLCMYVEKLNYSQYYPELYYVGHWGADLVQINTTQANQTIWRNNLFTDLD